MNTDTALGITVGVLIYFVLLIVVFIVSPPEVIGGTSLQGVQLSTETTYNTTISTDDVGTLELLGQFASFNLEGIPFIATILLVYFPAILLGVGIYGLIRGI